MKMRKIMAAGVAATLAVTSLAAVASAETLTFPMNYTEGTLKYAEKAGYEYTKTEMATADDIFKSDVDQNYTITYKEAPASAPTLTVKGVKKLDSDTPAFEATVTYEFKKVDGTNDLVYKLDLYKTEGPEGAFIPLQWERIDALSLSLTAKDYTTLKLSEYDAKADKAIAAGDIVFTKGTIDTADGNVLTANVVELFDKITGDNKISYSSQSKSDKFAFLKQTTTNKTIERRDIWKLSDTGAHVSTSVGDWATTDNQYDTEDGNQSYYDNGLGTNPNRFAGLASQVADFFNHQTNGTITMKFALGATSDSGWVSNGVPSTQIGIKNELNANNFALYVNYNSSTGSLEAATSVDVNAGSVTFDISEILADLGGQTKGVITDLYYGLNKGISYQAPYYNTGLCVEEITLAYEDDAAEEDIPAEEEEVVEEEEVTEEEEEEEEVTMEEEEEEATEEEEVVDGEMFEEEETEEEDVNPGTGVALAVVPAMIAAAAAVVSKKRK